MWKTNTWICTQICKKEWKSSWIPCTPYWLRYFLCRMTKERLFLLECLTDSWNFKRSTNGYRWKDLSNLCDKRGRWKLVAGGKSPPGFWNLTFSYEVLAKKRLFYLFREAKRNLFGPPGKIFTATSGKIRYCTSQLEKILLTPMTIKIAFLKLHERRDFADKVALNRTSVVFPYQNRLKRKCLEVTKSTRLRKTQILLVACLTVQRILSVYIAIRKLFSMCPSWLWPTMHWRNKEEI